MRYYHCDTAQVNRNEFRGYLKELDYDFNARTEAQLELNAYNIVESHEGMHSFSVIFTTS